MSMHAPPELVRMAGEEWRQPAPNWDFVSVIMPAYNAERFLAEAIQSILSQTHRHFELIVVDDGSTDGTKKIVEGFADQDERVRLVSVEHGGVSRARNKGLMVARGYWIALMDSDDVALPHRLKRQLEAARQAPEIDLWGSYATAINSRGKRFYTIALGPTTQEEFLRYRGTHACMFVIHPTWLARRELLVRAGGYISSFDGLEDFEFLTRIAAIGRVQVLPEELLLKRVHGTSTSNKVALQRKLEDFLWARGRARQQGQDLSFEDYLESLAARPLLTRLAERIADFGKHCYRQAALHTLEGRYAAATCCAACAVLLGPSYVFKRLARRLAPGKRPTLPTVAGSS